MSILDTFDRNWHVAALESIYIYIYHNLVIQQAYSDATILAH